MLRWQEVERERGVVVLLIVTVAAFLAYRNFKESKQFSTNMSRNNPAVEDPKLIDLCEKLWDLDKNRLEPDKDYKLDLQGRAKYSYDGPDRAKDPLFEFVDENVFKRDTYKAFIALLDNYEKETGVPEVVTKQEEAENWTFVNLVMKSNVMKEAYKFLKEQRKADADFDNFRKEFYNMWFRLYRRTRGERTQDSSGFEHVFVGETRGDKEVIGLHNWIQFYLQEKRGSIDYKGFMSGGRNPHMVTVQFAWKEEVKPKGSILIGVSPEFEITLYTVIFLMGYEAASITLGGDDVLVKCHKTAGKIGTCYPIALRKK
ncbi:uridylate-specific endoribonuclease B-like [Rhopilema esculentum]|uniref:uridylate-specific endoribonuclease B-like n=1 Tax=Rhopilema esculentum TaxID=499914 RepID=UPI0031DC8238